MNIDIDALEALTKTVTTGAAAQKSADPVIRNMGRLEFDDACKQYLRATNPAAIAALIAEVRALREDAGRWQSLVKWAVANAGEPSTNEFEFSFQPSGYNGGSFCWIEFGWRQPKWEHPTADQMNAAIDAARGAK